MLVVTADGWTARPIPLSIASCGLQQPIELEWLPAGTVRGRVTLPRAERLPSLGSLRVAGCPTAAEAESAALGDYPVRFRGDGTWWAQVPAGCLDLTLSVPPFAPARWTAVECRQGEEPRLREVALIRGAALTALVVAAESGHGVEGAVVYLIPEQQFVEAAGVAYRNDALDVEHWRRTDARGWVRFDAIPAGVYHLIAQPPLGSARAPGFSQPFELAEGVESVMEELPLPRSASLRIEVERGGEVEPRGGRLRATAIPILGSQVLAHSMKVIELGGQGFGVFEALIPGTWDVSLEWTFPAGSGALLGREEVVLVEGANETLSFEFEADVYRGRVTLFGEPIAGELNFRPRWDDYEGTLPRTESDEEGRFSLVVPESGRYLCEFHAKTGDLVTSVPEVRFEDPEEMLEIELPEGRIEGVVVNTDGEPVSEARVTASGAPRAALEQGGLRTAMLSAGTVSDADGRFALEALAESLWTLKARAGAQESEPLVTALGLDEFLPGIRLVVEDTIEIPIVVVSESREPVRGAAGTVAVPPSLPWELGPTLFFQADHQGRFGIRVPASVVDRVANVVLSAPGYSRTVLRTPLTPGTRIVLPRAYGRLELVPEEPWGMPDLLGLGLVASDGAGERVGNLGAASEAILASFPLPGTSRPIILPDLAPGTWRLVRLTSTYAEALVVLAGQGHQLPALATFTIQPGQTTRVEVPVEKRSRSKRAKKEEGR